MNDHQHHPMPPPRRALAGLALSGIAALAGCAATDVGPYRYSDGWREGKVTAVARAAQLERPQYYKCIRKTPPQQRESLTFAIVSYRNMGSSERHAVPLTGGGQAFSVGEAVYVNAGACEGAIAKR